MVKKGKKVFIGEDAVYNDFVEENGANYYDNVMSWYATRFLTCMSQRVLFFYLTSVICFCIFIFFSITAKLFPLNTAFPIVRESSDLNKIMTVVKVGETSEDRSKDELPSVSLARYLVEQYVVTRESYDYYSMDGFKEYIMNSSTSVARMEYERDFLDLRNPNSMLLRYQINGRRSAVVKDINLRVTDEGEPYEATVVMEILDRPLGSNTNHTERKTVSLNFDIPNLELVYMGYIQFFFKVSKYSYL